ncbi:hypothetical protein CSA17_05550 [bacterium DOLJORAL78_65_58]|nr:MAG: hypothetical protein CSB20_11010 [bacterium DOLZORAL124_64_63]PIE75800.1 MAG: hypothetical protein CSA17_05550 [bacterium DOLJORAL78_65_58]
MLEYLPWVIGLLVVLGLVAYVWNELKEKRAPQNPQERYHQALERWLDGDLEGATELLEKLVQDHPETIDPYQQLGTLLRLRGEPERAAALHRSLTVRRDLSRPRKVAAGLALAEDLLDMEQWDATRKVLDDLIRDASGTSPYWLARFRHWHGSGNRPEAARALKQGARSVPEPERETFQRRYAAYQLDRALEAVRAGDGGEARARLKDVRKIPLAHIRERLVRAMLAAAENNPTKALTVAAEDLLDNPAELAILLPLLQQVLLESGQFTRTLPILERACQAEHAPPDMWVHLALLYEKLGERDKAIHLLQAKSGRGQLTPDKAVPFLRLLAKEIAGTDFGRVWSLLDMPRDERHWVCRTCSQSLPHVRWFCPACHDFDSYVVRSAKDPERPKPSGQDARVPRETVPRETAPRESGLA